MTKMKPPYWKIGALCFVAAVLIIFGIIMGALWSSIYRNILKEALVLSETSTSYEMWKKTPIPMYMKIFMFNWTNHEEFGKNLSSKPNFVEMGPYVFRETDYKFVRAWNENGTITFRQKKVWVFQESMSNGQLTDMVTNLNPVAATIAYAIRNKKAWQKIAISAAIFGTEIEKRIVTQTVENLIFDGYNDPLLELATKWNIKLPFDKFGYFYGRNDSETYDGVFTMKTGAGSLADLGAIQEWNYKHKSQFYLNNCSEVKGSLGDSWPPALTNNTITVFSPDLCTSLVLEKSAQINFMGMTGNTFVSGPNMFDNGTNVESRKCYCQNSECQPSGTLNVSTCRYGAPAFISLPHFYLADESYRTQISGMKPTKDQHEFKIIIDEISGIPLKARAGMQLNFLVQPDKYISIFKHVPKTFIPMLWFKQEANLTANFAGQARLLTLLPMGGYVGVTLINIIGLALLAAATLIFVRNRNRGDDTRLLLSEDDGELAIPIQD